jgi:hypothetical protein
MTGGDLLRVEILDLQPRPGSKTRLKCPLPGLDIMRASQVRWHRLYRWHLGHSGGSDEFVTIYELMETTGQRVHAHVLGLPSMADSCGR